MIMLMETCTDVELDGFLLTVGTAFIINFKETLFFLIYFERIIINSWSLGTSFFEG